MPKRVNDFHPTPSMGGTFLLYLMGCLGSYFCAVQSIFFFIIIIRETQIRYKW
jgi:hypothetical protein